MVVVKKEGIRMVILYYRYNSLNNGNEHQFLLYTTYNIIFILRLVSTYLLIKLFLYSVK